MTRRKIACVFWALSARLSASTKIGFALTTALGLAPIGAGETVRHGVVNRSRIWELATAMVLICGLGLHGQGLDPRSALIRAGKSFAGRRSYTSAAAGQVSPVTATGTFVTFDAPGAVGGTFPESMNDAGVITGYYCDATTCHGFVRSNSGALVTFDVPGASATAALAINAEGNVAGIYIDASFAFHGFLRTPNGALTTFDVPGAEISAFCEYPCMALNPKGAITGIYTTNANFTTHCFLRAPDGVFTTVDPPGATSCFPALITPDGFILGNYDDANVMGHGFLRAPNGVFTTFDAPGVIQDPGGTVPTSINPAGEIAGHYIGAGFIRHASCALPVAR